MTNKYLSAIVAIVVVGVCYPFAKLPSISPTEQQALAARFKFERFPLPESPDHPAYKSVRKVHPSLERISAWTSSLGAAATLADLDGDSLPNDIIYVDPRTDLVTIAPAPGTGERYKPFALGTSTWTNGGYDLAALAPMGTVAGDFNEDGLIDVMVYFWGRTPLFYLRTASGNSSPGNPARSNEASLSTRAFVTRELVDTGELWYSTCALQADIDGDGHLDLLVGGYFQDGARILDAKADGTVMLHEGKSKALNGGYKHLFLWEGATAGQAPTARYREIKNVFSDDVARGWTLAMGAADLDDDLLPEIYIANDFGPDRLLHNRSTPGRPQFALLEGARDIATPKSCVLGNDSFKGMGVDFGDVNGDGLLDIYVSNIAAKFALTESHFLWLNTGQPDQMKHGIAPFVHGSEKLGLARSGFAFEARLADFDNDGVPEALQACGFIKGKINRWPELQALGTSNDQIVHNPRFWPSFRPGVDLSGHDWNPFFVRNSRGRYYDLAPALSLTEPMVSRGIGIADVEHDGRLDFVTANQWGPSYLFKNHAPSSNAFLGLRLLHPKGSPAVGAVARIRLPESYNQLVGYVDGGNGHSGRRSPEIHFGLGKWDKTKPVPVVIRWRDQAGRVQEVSQQLMPGWQTVTLGREGNANQRVIAQRPGTAAAPALQLFEKQPGHSETLLP